MANESYDPFYEEPTRKSGCGGCLLWGCLISALLGLLLLVGIPVAGYFAIKHYVNKYTTDKPAAVEVVKLEEQELLELQNRFESFEAAVKEGAGPPDFEVTARELNGLINSNEELKGRVFVRIADGQVGGDLSFPADALPGGGERFFNATADFKVSLDGGVLIVTLADATINGVQLPKQALDALASENLAKDAYKDPDTAKLLRRFESLEIIGDRIVLKAKRPSPAEVKAEVETFEDLNGISDSQPTPSVEVPSEPATESR